MYIGVQLWDNTNAPRMTRAATLKSTLFTRWKTTKAATDYLPYAKQCNIVKATTRCAQCDYEKNLIQQFQSYPIILYRHLKVNKTLDIISLNYRSLMAL